MAAKRKYRCLSNEERARMLEELRLGRYYRRKSIAARFGIEVTTTWRIEQQEREHREHMNENDGGMKCDSKPQLQR